MIPAEGVECAWLPGLGRWVAVVHGVDPGERVALYLQGHDPRGIRTGPESFIPWPADPAEPTIEQGEVMAGDSFMEWPEKPVAEAEAGLAPRVVLHDAGHGAGARVQITALADPMMKHRLHISEPVIEKGVQISERILTEGGWRDVGSHEGPAPSNGIPISERTADLIRSVDYSKWAKTSRELDEVKAQLAESNRHVLELEAEAVKAGTVNDWQEIAEAWRLFARTLLEQEAEPAVMTSEDFGGAASLAAYEADVPEGESYIEIPGPKRQRPDESPLIAHADRELELVRRATEGPNKDPRDAEDEKRMHDSLRAAVAGFAQYRGHSGGSHSWAVDTLVRLLELKTLTTATSDPAEWMEVGPNVWQNLRQSSLFSEDGGQTWHDVNETEQPSEPGPLTKDPTPVQILATLRGGMNVLKTRSTYRPDIDILIEMLDLLEQLKGRLS